MRIFVEAYAYDEARVEWSAALARATLLIDADGAIAP
jgi:hypothetical protein